MTTQESGVSFAFEELLARSAELRERGPVHHDEERGLWRVLDHAGVSRVLSDPAGFSSDFSGLTPVQEDFETFRKGNFVGMDPPDHRKLRTLVSQAFTPRVVAGLEPRIRAIAGELLDEVAGESRFDVVDALAYPLPIIVIAELLGVPVADRPLFTRWAQVLFSGDQLGESADMEDIQRALDAIAPTIREMNAYILDHIRHHRAHPGPGLTSRLVEAEFDGERLEDQEIVGFVALLLIAGHITTTALLGNAVVTFDRNPAAAAALRSAPESVPAALEEVLRLLPPFPELGRRTTREVELGGHRIPENSIVMADLASANRDPAVFDRPDAFEPGRTPNPHQTFGHGIHFCFGAPLARLEGRIAFEVLFSRYRDLAVATDAPVVFQNPSVIVSVRHLPLDVERA
ncbi:MULTISPECIES: cytochrome P450 [unclassified Amycolatopsis]|uniref:cytochrome P450 n=1 Tax=unclassified Amycolatopsis TaxID=2618356 RepID=UPI0028746605|nr:MULTISPECIES: cytochrome P450 [unclassified Amycolatopsis]MDS0140065.1 cytochrome P450 [Amycolatopsis sp. 505]MDS0146916.1 cytochrome P450 [Amycolatopsis sp. CM201R]